MRRFPLGGGLPLVDPVPAQLSGGPLSEPLFVASPLILVRGPPPAPILPGLFRVRGPPRELVLPFPFRVRSAPRKPAPVVALHTFTVAHAALRDVPTPAGLAGEVARQAERSGLVTADDVRGVRQTVIPCCSDSGGDSSPANRAAFGESRPLLLMCFLVSSERLSMRTMCRCPIAEAHLHLLTRCEG